MKTYSVRKATPSYFNDILDLYKKGLEENNITDYKESALVNKIITSYALAPCFMLCYDDKIIGMAGLTAVVLSHNSEISLADYMFYVEKEHRNIKTLRALVDSVKEFASEAKLPIRLDFIANNNLIAKDRLFKMFGFKTFTIAGVYDGR